MLAKQFKKKKNETPDKVSKISESEVKSKKKPKLKKKKRLIVRNLAFQVNEDDLKTVFSKFGNVVDVKIPLKEDGRKRGFGFVEFDNTKSLIQAMKSMNYKEIKGRKVAIDFAVDKTTYQLKVKNLDEKKTNEDTSSNKSEISSDESEDEDDAEEEEEEDEDEKRLNAFLKEFDSGAEALTKSKDPEEEDSSDSEESFSEDSEDELEPEKNDIKTSKKRKHDFDLSDDLPDKKKLKKESHDVSEGKTVFIRNVAFTTTNESLKEALEDFGESEYCLICVDRLADHPKGTAFIKFKEKSSADKLIEESIKEPGVEVDGRKLSCSYAISRDEVTRLNDNPKKPKDKRNLNLLRVGLIMQDSKESEGVSGADMARRAQLEMTKKIKLKNVNFFVSDTRLAIHNLPKVYSDGELRKLFKNAAGPGSIITEARVMKEFGKTDASGNPVSKGFGFVTFSNHEDALNALNKLNNNPDIFTSQRRPIVEFAVENKVAILTKERRREKNKMRNKKRTEEKMARQQFQLKEEAASKTKPSKKRRGEKIANQQLQQKDDASKKKSPKKKQRKGFGNINIERKEKANEAANNPTNEKKRSIEGKQKNKKPKKKNKGMKTADMNAKQASVTDLVNIYKDKLKNKIA